MKRHLVLVALALPLIQLVPAQASASTTSGGPLAAGINRVLPSVVLVLNDTTGSLTDSNGVIHGPYELSFLGTGFFVSTDGYLATAAHVGAPSSDDIKGELVDAYISDSYGCNPVTALDNCSAVQNRHHDEVAAQMTAVHTDVILHVLTQNMGPNAAGLPAFVAASSSSSSRDVAILKVDGNNEPVALLNSSAAVNLGDDVAALGYPSSSENGIGGLTVVPTVTTGTVNRKLDSDPYGPAANQAHLLEFNARIEHGNSGGPGVDALGNVDGLVSFGVLNFNDNFLVSADDIRAVLARTPAHNALGTIDQLYRQALDAVANGDTTAAKLLFQQCATLNPVQVYCAAGLSGKVSSATVANFAAVGNLGSVLNAIPHQNVSSSQMLAALATVIGLAALLVSISLRFRRRPPLEDISPLWTYTLPQGWSTAPEHFTRPVMRPYSLAPPPPPIVPPPPPLPLIAEWKPLPPHRPS